MAETQKEELLHKPFPMHRGTALKSSRISEITRREFTPIVFLAGATGSGKTTLLASVYEAFQFAPLAGYSFGGSLTMLGFEEKCFEARARSGSNKTDTPRTQPKDGQEFFHLRLRGSPSEPFRELLFADMSGEFYERAVNNAAELREKEFEILTRCDFLVLLLDGEKLLDPFRRQNVRRDAHTFILRCLELNLLLPHTVFQVMISKWDKVALRSNEEIKSCKNFVESVFSTEILKRPLEVLPIASRPAEYSAEIGKLYGIKDLFPGWVEAVSPILRPSEPKNINVPAKRMFSRMVL
jgi:hypothetical protein